MELTQSTTAHNRGVVAITEYLGGIITAARDGKIKYWGEKNYQHRAHAGGVRALESSQEYLYSAGDSVKVWKGAELYHEVEEPGVGCLASIGGFGLVTGGRSFLKLWDLRMKKCAGTVSDKGPFLECMGWDEVGVWTGSERGLRVRDI